MPFCQSMESGRQCSAIGLSYRGFLTCKLGRQARQRTAGSREGHYPIGCQRQHEPVALQSCGTGGAAGSRRAGGEDKHSALGEGVALFRRDLVVGETAGQEFDHPALAAQDGAQHLLLQRGVKTAQDNPALFDPLGYTVKGFDEQFAGAFAGGNQPEQRLVQQCGIADAEPVSLSIGAGPLVEDGGQREREYFHASSSAPLMRYLTS